MNVTWIWVPNVAGDDYLLNINTGATISLTKVHDMFMIQHGSHVLAEYESGENAADTMTKLGKRLGAEYLTMITGD